MEPVQADLAGRVCLVTGASSGIGRQTAAELARLGATVVMGCRSRERGEAARRDIAESTGSRALEVLQVDLARQESILSFGAEVRRRHPALHVLVNNAGMWSPGRRLSPDAIELTWATNMLGYFLVTEELRPLLLASAPARIVNVVSDLARDLDLEDVQFVRRPYDGILAYAQSKQANRMWTWALARRVEGTGLTANAVHPGGVRTGIFRKGGGVKSVLADLVMKVMGKSVRVGADSVVWLAASPEVEGLSGRYWAARKERRCRYRDAEREEKLWALCASMTRVAATA